MLKYILQKMSLITREGKGSKLTIEELDNNLLGLNNMTFVGENLSNYIGDLENIQAGFYSEQITGLIPDIQSIIFALEMNNGAYFFQPALLESDIAYMGTKVSATASLTEPTGFLEIKFINHLTDIILYENQNTRRISQNSTIRRWNRS